jgi:hypothetical protein
VLDNAIGGYFELELPAPKGQLYPNALGFQSARAAFLALLRAGKPKRIWMPYYICGSMIESVIQAGIEPVFYHVDCDLHIAEKPILADGEWILYVNYFGIRDEYANFLLSTFGAQRVVIDCSQALFAVPDACLATIYSPRKFMGVPDGGFLVSSVPVNQPQQTDEESINRTTHLLKRLAFSPEAGYQDFQRENRSLIGQEPKGMSDLTRKILSTVDYGSIRAARKRNFGLLHNHLGRFNLLQIDPGRLAGPLCYPLLTRHKALRDDLIANKVFVAKYWPEILDQALTGDETFLVEHLVPLPCDQRYGPTEMQRIVDVCLEFLRFERR